MKKNKIVVALLIVIIVLLVAILGFGGYKYMELDKDYNSLDNNYKEMKEKLDKQEKENQEVTEELAKQKEETEKIKSDQNTSKTNSYDKYVGTWSDGNNNTFKVQTISNDYIGFSWFIYRAASIDGVVLPLKNKQAVFYFEGYDDKNFNEINEKNEYYCREAIIQLKDSSILVKVEKSSGCASITVDNLDLDKSEQFGGGVYIEPSQFNFATKIK